MKTRFLALVAIAVAILSPGCAPQDNTADTPAYRTVEVEGVYHPALERARFTPSTGEFSGQEWWLNGNQEFIDRYAEFSDGAVEEGRSMFGTGVFVRLRGRLMGPGKYGHLGQWKYNFTVDEVLEMRRAGPGPTDDTSPQWSASQWGSIRGRVIFVGDEVPEPTLFVRKGDSNAKDAAVSAAQDIFSEDLVIHKENRGVRWAIISINKPPAIHPDLAKTDGEIELSIQGCTFHPHLLAIREGQRLRVVNRDPVCQNPKADAFKNPSRNPLLNAAPAGGTTEFMAPDLVAEKLPIRLMENCHPWMKAWIGVFNHPYFAVTDEDGRFEIRNLPAEKVRLVVWQEKIGFGEGKGNGTEIEVKANETTDLGKLRFELPKSVDGK